MTRDVSRRMVRRRIKPISADEALRLGEDLVARADGELEVKGWRRPTASSRDRFVPPLSEEEDGRAVGANLGRRSLPSMLLLSPLGNATNSDTTFTTAQASGPIAGERPRLSRLNVTMGVLSERRA